jgi:hypothetical protein
MRFLQSQQLDAVPTAFRRIIATLFFKTQMLWHWHSPPFELCVTHSANRHGHPTPLSHPVRLTPQKKSCSSHSTGRRGHSPARRIRPAALRCHHASPSCARPLTPASPAHAPILRHTTPPPCTHSASARPSTLSPPGHPLCLRAPHSTSARPSVTAIHRRTPNPHHRHHPGITERRSSPAKTSSHVVVRRHHGREDPYVANACFKCFIHFMSMLQLFHLDVAKVNRGMLHVLHMLLVFQRHVASICSKCFICF